MKHIIYCLPFSLLLFAVDCSRGPQIAQGNSANAGVQQVNNLTKATVEISAETGGYINVGNTQLVIPQGAISSDATITAELVDVPETVAGAQKLGKGIKFSPEGLQFLTPAELSVCYEASQMAGLNENSAMIYYKDHSNNLVGISGNVNKATRCVKSHIEHFSSYIAVAQAQVAGNTAPTVAGANFLPTTPLAGIPLRVRTQINDVNGGAVTGQVASAFLYYRTVGAPTYTKVPLTPDTTDDTTTNRYAFLIPAAEVTLAGIQYYFEATDNLNVTTTTTPVIRTVPNAANGIRFDIATLSIGAGFTRALTLQASDAAPGGTWQNISIENQNISNAALGTLQRTTPSAIRLTTNGAGTGTITSTAGAFTATSNVTVIAGLLSHIVITDLNQVALTGTYLIGINQTVDLDAVGYDSFGNISTIKPAFSTTGGIGSVTVDLTGAHFTAGASATTGVLTANIAGLTDTLDFLVYVPPAVAATAPVDGATNVNYIGSNIAVTFTKSMDTATLTTNTTSVCSGSIQVSNTNFTDCVPMTSVNPQFFSGNALAIVTPAAPLLGNTTYKVRVLAIARDTFNYPMAGTYTSTTGFTTMPDITPPVAGAAITFSNVRNRQMTVSWGSATDAGTAASGLQYKLVKDDFSTANIATVALADAKSGADLVQDWMPNIVTLNVTGLTATTNYHFAVLVRDAGGNMVLYTPLTQATTTWEAGPNTSIARLYHTATWLSDGRVLVTGGEGSAGSYDVVDSAEIFDPAGNAGAGAFMLTGSMTLKRKFHTATLLPNGKVLIAGGETLNGFTPINVEIFDPAGNGGAGSFAASASMATGRAHHTATLLPNGKVLIAGGRNDAGQILATAEIFDPLGNASAGSFTSTGAMTSVRAFHAATLTNGKVLVTGGYAGGSVYTATAELFDPSANAGVGTFGAISAMFSGRADHNSSLLPNGTVLINGGWNSTATDALAAAEVFDPLGNAGAGAFGATGGMTSKRAYAASVLLPNGLVLATGGHGGMNLLNTAETYDLTANAGLGVFTAIASMATIRLHHTATVLIDGRVIVIGGSNGSSPLASTEIFQ